MHTIRTLRDYQFRFRRTTVGASERKPMGSPISGFIAEPVKTWAHGPTDNSTETMGPLRG